MEGRERGRGEGRGQERERIEGREMEGGREQEGGGGRGESAYVCVCVCVCARARACVCVCKGVRQQVCEASHPPPSSAKAKNEWSHSSTPPCVFTIQTGTTSPLPNPPNLAKYMVTQHSLCANHKNKQKANFKKTEVRNLTKDKVTVHHSDPVHAAKWSDEEHVKIISAL